MNKCPICNKEIKVECHSEFIDGVIPMTGILIHIRCGKDVIAEHLKAMK